MVFLGICPKSLEWSISCCCLQGTVFFTRSLPALAAVSTDTHCTSLSIIFFVTFDVAFCFQQQQHVDNRCKKCSFHVRSHLPDAARFLPFIASWILFIPPLPAASVSYLSFSIISFSSSSSASGTVQSVTPSLFNLQQTILPLCFLLYSSMQLQNKHVCVCVYNISNWIHLWIIYHFTSYCLWHYNSILPLVNIIHLGGKGLIY